MRKIGIIDVGSNSHRLLAVAIEGETITELTRGKITTRMLSGLKDGAFTPECILKNLQAILTLKEQAQQAQRGAQLPHVNPSASFFADAVNIPRS